MGFETVTISPVALTDLESARDYLKLGNNERDPWLTVIINEATGLMERMTRRRLKSRTYDGMTWPALLVDGDGSNLILLPEYPVTAVSSVRWRDASDAYTSSTITSARFGGEGYLYLPNDSFPKGFKNIEVKCTAGYVAGTHDAELSALELCCKRLIQIGYSDWDNKLARGTGISIQGFSVNFVRSALPRDVMETIDQFTRVA